MYKFIFTCSIAIEQMEGLGNFHFLSAQVDMMEEPKSSICCLYFVSCQNVKSKVTCILTLKVFVFP